MRVKTWIKALSEMDPELEVRAMNLLGDWVSVAPVEGAKVRKPPMRKLPPDAPRRRFVKIIREEDQHPPPWARW